MKGALVIWLIIGVIVAEDNDYLQSNLLFSSDLYKEHAKNGHTNFLLSPLSAQTILALATVGGEGNTAQQLSQALHLSSNKQQIKNTFKTLSENSKDSSAYQFSSANSIYVNNSVSIKKDYKEIAQNDFKASVENINFNNLKEAVKKINDWVESKTNNKITDLLNENLLDPNTVLVMVNALYFHGYWESEFGEANEETFYISKEKTVNMYMMTQRNDFNYYEDKSLNAQFLEMPFKGGDVVMTFVVPKQIDGLSSLEKDISKVLAVDKLSLQDVVVTIPKFKIESEVNLKLILQSLGVVEAFSNAANFKEISDLPLQIDQVVQKTFIEVNEKGATAAAATGITMIPVSMPQAFFSADRPFLFYLRHKVYGVFFVGRFMNP